MGAKIYQEDSSTRQIGNLFFVLIAAVVSGVLVVAAMIHYWGPEGGYALHDVLLAPDVLPQLSYGSSGTNTKNSERLVFDAIDFKYFDSMHHQWETRPVPVGVYERFYALIKGDRSLTDPGQAAGRFDASHASRLTIWIRPSNGSSADRRIFQEVSFSTEGSLYRVELHGQKSGEWIYFEHPAIQPSLMALFVTNR